MDLQGSCSIVTCVLVVVCITVMVTQSCRAQRRGSSTEAKRRNSRALRKKGTFLPKKKVVKIEMFRLIHIYLRQFVLPHTIFLLFED